MLIILKNKFNATYNKIIHWRKSQFLLPSGSMGKRAFEEMTRIITRWTFKSEQDTCNESSNSLTNFTNSKKASFTSKLKDNVETLERKLN